MDNAAELVAGMSAADIRNNEPRLYLQFQKLDAAVPIIQSIWIYGSDGHALVTSSVHPPPAASFADRDFFTAHVDANIGTYYGQIYNSTFNNQPFFTVSRRLARDGAFLGVLEASVLPSNFFRFFSTLAYTQGLQYALIRNDGLFLSRYPEAPTGATAKLDEHTGFRRTIAAHPEGGLYVTTSPVDHIERRFGVRRFGNTPLYLSAGIASSTIRDEWLRGMSAHLIFGIPATLILFLTLLVVLRRTQRLYEEMDRRVAAEELLRQSQKLEAIGHLTGGIAHDFNNLLTIIIGNLETAQQNLESWTDGAQVRLARRVENAMHGAQRAATLTKRLLAFSRQQPLSPSPLDVNRLLNGLADFLKRALGEDVSLEIVGHGGVWLVEADAAELEAVVLNLAVNARDAMPDGGKLTIETSNSYLDEAYCRQHDVAPGQYVLIAVTDTGSGMTQGGHRARLRAVLHDQAVRPGHRPGPQPGVRFRQAVRRPREDLQRARRRHHHQDLSAPLHRQSSRHRRKTATEPSRGQTGECILVVEDDPEVRSYVAETLGGLGYDVLEAPGGDAALKMMEEHNAIGLLLTDVVMPGMNGRQLAEEAKRRQPALKVLFMTGYSRNAIVHQGRLDPGVELLQKPINSEQLAAMVRKLLDG